MNGILGLTLREVGYGLIHDDDRMMEASMEKMEQEKNALLEKVALLESDVEGMQEYEAKLQRLRDEIKELKDDANIRSTRQPDRLPTSRDRSASPVAQLARHDNLYDELQKQVQVTFYFHFHVAGYEIDNACRI